MTDPKARQALRKAFLRALYERVNSSVTEFVNAFDIGDGLSLERAESQRILEYFAEKGHVMVDDYTTGTVRITATGVDTVELDA
jgi:ATP phosphoribosyltransferase regulatory subunit HisZ